MIPSADNLLSCYDSREERSDSSGGRLLYGGPGLETGAAALLCPAVGDGGVQGYAVGVLNLGQLGIGLGLGYSAVLLPQVHTK